MVGDETLKTTVVVEIEKWIQQRLMDRKSVSLVSVGLFEPCFEPEYVAVSPHGERTLMPPTIVLHFIPSPYLLRQEHYITLSYTAPEKYVGIEVVRYVADMLGKSTDTVEEQLSLYFSEQYKALFGGKRISLLGLGDLYVSEEEDTGVAILHFTPSEALSAQLNRPFSLFRPQKMRIDKHYSDLKEQPMETEESPTVADNIQAFPLTLSEKKIEAFPEEKEENVLEVPDLPIFEIKTEFGTATTEIPYTPKKTKEKISKQPKKIATAIWLLLLLLILLAGGSYMWRQKSKLPAYNSSVFTPTIVDSIATESLVPNSTVLQTDTISSPAPIDTVQMRTGDNLNRFARRFYGEQLFWVYIYMYNQNTIANPDNIAPNTELIIPSLELYKINSDTYIAKEEAKRWANLIITHRFHNYEEQRDSLYNTIVPLYK